MADELTVNELKELVDYYKKLYFFMNDSIKMTYDTIEDNCRLINEYRDKLLKERHDKEQLEKEYAQLENAYNKCLKEINNLRRENVRINDRIGD